MSRASRLALSLALCLCLPLAAGCSSSDSKPADDTTKEEEVVLTDEDAKETDLTDEAEDEDDKTDAAEADDTDDADDADEQTQHVGADGTGFVDVPATWVEFHDTDGNDSIQWCDGTPYTIISLNTFDIESVPEEERASFDAVAAANSVWANMLNDGVEEDSVQGARVKLAGRDAVQVYGVYPDGSFLVCWLLQDDAGVIRYVAAEGTQDTIMDSVEIVENTYAL